MHVMIPNALSSPDDFLQWIFFYSSGIIQENFCHEQVKIIKYNYLVVNLIVLHNVNAMAKALKRLKRSDFDVTPEMRVALSPYRISHINLLGQYPLEYLPMTRRCRKRSGSFPLKRQALRHR